MRLFLKHIDWILEVESHTTNKNIHTIVCNWPDDRKMGLTQPIVSIVIIDKNVGFFFPEKCISNIAIEGARSETRTLFFSWISLQMLLWTLFQLKTLK